jgi:hypothetical protein
MLFSWITFFSPEGSKIPEGQPLIKKQENEANPFIHLINRTMSDLDPKPKPRKTLHRTVSYKLT